MVSRTGVSLLMRRSLTAAKLVAPLVLVGVFAQYFWRRRKVQPPPSVQTPTDADDSGRSERHRALAEHEDELLQRRSDLESRRGTLGGNDEIYDEFVSLEGRLQAGEIDESEFEREKIRLLGG